MDRNCGTSIGLTYDGLSLSARRAWIEIILPPVDTSSIKVALRKESVDRNKLLGLLGWLRTLVALRKESVDRNCSVTLSLMGSLPSLSARRAWIEIRKRNTPSHNPKLSLSARRAWIEMMMEEDMILEEQVALRKESVDRNKYVVQCRKVLGVSLSARRAWIEIITRTRTLTGCVVALRKESVDRNTSIDDLTQGVFKSLSARRAWIEIHTILGGF